MESVVTFLQDVVPQVTFLFFFLIQFFYWIDNNIISN